MVYIKLHDYIRMVTVHTGSSSMSFIPVIKGLLELLAPDYLISFIVSYKQLRYLSIKKNKFILNYGRKDIFI